LTGDAPHWEHRSQVRLSYEIRGVIGLLTASDDELLTATDAASFEQFYRRHFESVLAFFVRRTRDPELAADLCAETFAAALLARRRYRAGRGRADSWLFSIAYRKLSDTRRRGRAEDRALRRLGAQAPALTSDDLAWIEQLGAADRASQLVEELPADQREAIRAYVVDERGYDDIATATHSSQAAVRKRVSRGLTVVRRRMGVSK
jgi:RNA polymerase sigma factor (sigma-70 family)